MQFNGVNNKERLHFPGSRWCQHNVHISEFHMLMGHSVAYVQEAFFDVFVLVGHHLSRQFPYHPISYLSFHCFNSLPVPLTVWGFMAGLPGFARHWSSLPLGAGSQWWKLLEVSGTQPPFSDAVVTYSFPLHVPVSSKMLTEDTANKIFSLVLSFLMDFNNSNPLLFSGICSVTLTCLILMS